MKDRCMMKSDLAVGDRIPLEVTKICDAEGRSIRIAPERVCFGVLLPRVTVSFLLFFDDKRHEFKSEPEAVAFIKHRYPDAVVAPWPLLPNGLYFGVEREVAGECSIPCSFYENDAAVLHEEFKAEGDTRIVAAGTMSWLCRLDK